MEWHIELGDGETHPQIKEVPIDGDSLADRAYTEGHRLSVSKRQPEQRAAKSHFWC